MEQHLEKLLNGDHRLTDARGDGTNVTFIDNKASKLLKLILGIKRLR